MKRGRIARHLWLVEKILIWPVAYMPIRIADILLIVGVIAVLAWLT